ncbi:MerR family transcriptional regulator [Pseudomonas panipatensis]|uniref:MerR family transcriptional regulator n=1 Tax=Pseudomonas panipatensis TaxID=428992 RepID=UPI0035AE2942
MYIGKAARLSGTTVKSIRHYEDIGLLPPPRREGRYRVYSQQSVEFLMLIKCAQQMGFKLRELRTMLDGHHGDAFPWELAKQAIAGKKAELGAQIDALQAQRDGLDAFARTLDAARQECPLEYLAGPAERPRGQR